MKRKMTKKRWNENLFNFKSINTFWHPERSQLFDDSYVDGTHDYDNNSSHISVHRKTLSITSLENNLKSYPLSINYGKIEINLWRKMLSIISEINKKLNFSSIIFLFFSL